MNKAHNNLNIENLIKTKAFNKLTSEQKKELLTSSQWIKQFQPYQQEEILTGIKNNVDISIYANKEYGWIQMSELREGLEANLDVSSYAKVEIDEKTMRKRKTQLLNEQKNTQ